ncbi:MAG: GNAT family N-acetyltransferase [Eubacteriales bacterium]|nr:GNAT family N-acetyltransferase [Eubacteriales bacterium]
MEISPVPERDIQRALDLVLRVFLAFEAPDYCEQGVETFRSFLQSSEELKKLHFYGAYEAGSLAGVLATRGEDGSHIALFFVDAVWQGRGVGRALFTAAREQCRGERMTVHSSPYAKAIYEHLGFTAVSGEQLSDGIRYYPMQYSKAETKGAYFHAD